MTPRNVHRTQNLARYSDSYAIDPVIKAYSCKISLNFSFLPTHQFHVTCFRLAGPFPVPKPIENPMQIIILIISTTKAIFFFPNQLSQPFLSIKINRYTAIPRLPKILYAPPNIPAYQETLHNISFMTPSIDLMIYVKTGIRTIRC